MSRRNLPLLVADQQFLSFYNVATDQIHLSLPHKIERCCIYIVQAIGQASPCLVLVTNKEFNKQINSFLSLITKHKPLARQLNTKLTGAIGNLSFYKMYDTYYVRIKSQGGKQTQRTKARQKDFAIAASLSKNIRLALHAAIPKPKQKAMQNRLTKALLQWQLSRAALETNTAVIQQLNNFQFIEEAPLQTICNIPVSINKTPEDGLQIIIPSFTPKQSVKAG